MQSVKTPAEQHEFDSLDQECERYVDSLAAAKPASEKTLDATATILVIAVAVLLWFGATFGHDRVG